MPINVEIEKIVEVIQEVIVEKEVIKEIEVEKKVYVDRVIEKEIYKQDDNG